MENNVKDLGFDSSIYNQKIGKTIPYYAEIQKQAVSLVNTLGMKNISWLDVGCGTGNMAKLAIRQCDVKTMCLAEPSEDMLSYAIKESASWNVAVQSVQSSTQELVFQEQFDVVTAIQAHHYLKKEQKKQAVAACYQALKPGGVFITCENTAAMTETGKEIALNRWKNYQVTSGKTKEDAQANIDRYGKLYFPITVFEQLAILKECGFQTVELLWYSYSQAEIYGLK